MEIPEERRPPEGHIWACSACGRWAKDRYGLIGSHSSGWDESCMMNAVPVELAAVGGDDD